MIVTLGSLKSRRTKILSILMTIIILIVVVRYFGKPHIVHSPFIRVVISPNGEKAAAVAAFAEGQSYKGHLYILQSNGKQISDTVKGGVMSDPAWSADSKTLFFSGPRRVQGTQVADAICSVDIDNPSQVTTVVGLPELSLSASAASSDGVHLAYVQRYYSPETGSVRTTRVYDLNSKQEWGMAPYRNFDLTRPKWSSDGAIIAFQGSATAADQNNYLPEDSVSSIANTGGLVWATSKEGFVPHFISARFSDFQPSSDGNQFALIAGRDATRGDKHLLQVVDKSGKELGKIKRRSIAPDVAWNSTNTAIFFLDNFYTIKLKLCRWDLKTGQVGVLQRLPEMRGRILGYRNGTLFYTTATMKDNDTCQINQLTTD